MDRIDPNLVIALGWATDALLSSHRAEIDTLTNSIRFNENSEQVLGKEKESPFEIGTRWFLTVLEREGYKVVKVGEDK